MVEWKKMEEYVEDPQGFPNEEVMLLVEITGDNTQCLIDEVEGQQYCTMGHWYPKIELRDGSVEEGHWEYVGWDWCQDCFVGTKGDKVIGWYPMPDTGARSEERAGGFMVFEVPDKV